MSLGGGRFGPPLKTERTEKHWVDDDEWRFFYKDQNYCKSLIEDYWFYYWLTDFKFYGAERIEC